MQRRLPAVAGRLSTVLVMLVLAGCGGISIYPVRDAWIVDDDPAWSPDGHHIALNRFVTTPDGPPGLYVVDTVDGSARRIGPVTAFELSYSPDGRFLAGVGGGGLVRIDVASGVVEPLLHSDNGPSDPQWSPDGRRIVYLRFLRGYEEPQDSVGLHLLDLASGEDHVLHDVADSLVRGAYPQWSPDGSSLVYRGDGGIELLHLDTRIVERLTHPRGTGAHSRPRFIRGGAAVIYSVLGAPIYGTRVIDLATRVDRPWPFATGLLFAMSPADSEYVSRSVDPGDDQGEVYVLHRRRLDDATGSTLRILTTEFPLPNDARSGVDPLASGMARR